MPIELRTAGPDKADPSSEDNVFLSVALAAGGGYADAGGYILAKSFAGHITGNTVLFAIALARGDRSGMIVPLLAVCCFALATAVGIGIAAMADKPSRAISITIIAESVLVFAAPFGLLQHGTHATLELILPLCLALGLQNGVYRKVGGVGLHTSYITGDVTTLLTTLIERKTGESQPPQKARTVFRVWISFALGALLAGVLLGHYGVKALWILELPLCLAAWLAWRLAQLPSSQQKINR